jgi:hypothetical protein
MVEGFVKEGYLMINEYREFCIKLLKSLQAWCVCHFERSRESVWA